MERIRRISAILIAVSLVLPERSCLNDGQVETTYPLSGADSLISASLILVLYLLPFIGQFTPRFRSSGLVAGICAAGTGLYFFSYGSWAVGSKLLLGWYVYTISAIVYIATALESLVRLVAGRILARKDRDAAERKS